MVSAASQTSITWSWNAVEGAVGYRVQVSADPVFNDTDTIHEISETAFTVSGLAAETAVHVRVAANVGTTEVPVLSPWTAPVTGVSVMPSAPAPTGLMVSAATETSITWSWNAVEGAVGYRVQVSADPAFDDTDTIHEITETAFTVSGLASETNVHVRVAANVGTTEVPVLSPWTAPVTGVSVMPSAPTPTGLMVSAATETSITWSWNAVEGAVGYRVQVSADPVFDDTDTIHETTETVFTVSGLASETSVHVRVAANVGTTEVPVLSQWTAAVTAMSAMPLPELPSHSVCERTPQVREAIRAMLSLADCSAVTNGQLRMIRVLDLEFQSLTSLQSGDFSGMSGLESLYLRGNALASLPEDLFAGLTSLTRLNLQRNLLTSLPVGLFSGLDALRELWLDENPLTTESFPHGIFAGLSSLTDLSTWPTLVRATDIVFPLIVEEVSRSNGEIRLRIVFPHGAPGPLQISLRTTTHAEVSVPYVTIHSGETHSEEFVLTPSGRGWQLSATWDWKTRYPHIVLEYYPRGFRIPPTVLDNPVGMRSSADRPDDISGPQIHVVYATRTGDEDRELDRNGSVDGSFEIIQEWLESEIGRTLRLDTYDGELDVTYLQVDDADIPDRRCPGCGPEPRGGDYLGYIRSLFPNSTSKKYAVFLDIHEAGNLSGLGSDEAGIAVTFLKGRTPAGAKGIGSVEQVMLHEIIHALGGVGDCAPNSTARIEEFQASCGATGHVTDDKFDLMGVEVNTEERSITYFGGTTLDADRNDYIGHGRPGCFDLLESPFVE